ncbi:unnamed protein product [Diamesa tonsa]
MITTDKSNFEGREGIIRCILLSEFHAKIGSKISCQTPENYVSKEVFDAINVYILPKPQLERQIITVNTLGYKLVGYPIKIDNQRYARNAFYFNLCFVCDSHSRSVQYETVVKKLAEYFIMMEDETGFLSKEDNKSKIQSILNKILKDLNEKYLSTVIEGETTIHLKIVKIQTDPPLCFDSQVPVLKSEFENMSLESWDLTTRQVLPFINGINHIARIAASADVENALVKSCIQNLVYYNVAELMPLFKYCNVYMCTRSLQKLSKYPSIGNECVSFVTIKDDLPPPTLYHILQLYSQMTHGVNLKTLCIRLSPRQHNIDERKLVKFGLKHNLIRCINKYPIFTGSMPNGRQKLYNGINTLDEICCKTGLSANKIEEFIDSDTNVTIIWK